MNVISAVKFLYRKSVSDGSLVKDSIKIDDYELNIKDIFGIMYGFNKKVMSVYAYLNGEKNHFEIHGVTLAFYKEVIKDFKFEIRLLNY